MLLREDTIMFSKKQTGFTLIELMVSLVIGLFLLAGVFTIYLSSVKTKSVVDDEVEMMRNAQFALETLAFDLRHAGSYGLRNFEDKIKLMDEETLSGEAGECGTDWAINIDRAVYAADDATDYAGTCMQNWSQGDTLEFRYATPLPIGTLEENLQPNAIYLKAIPKYAYMFLGDTPPPSFPFIKDDGSEKDNIRYFLWQSRAYYVADFTDEAGDGIPSLRLLALEPGPNVTDSILLRGVEDVQIKFGLDTPLAGNSQGNASANMYVNPDSVGNRWNQVIAARIWVVVRSEKETDELVNNPAYEVAGSFVTPTDKYRRIVVSTTVRLRNLNTF